MGLKTYAMMCIGILALGIVALSEIQSSYAAKPADKGNQFWANCWFEDTYTGVSVYASTGGGVYGIRITLWSAGAENVDEIFYPGPPYPKWVSFEKNYPDFTAHSIEVQVLDKNLREKASSGVVSCYTR